MINHDYCGLAVFKEMMTKAQPIPSTLEASLSQSWPVLVGQAVAVGHSTSRERAAGGAASNLKL